MVPNKKPVAISAASVVIAGIFFAILFVVAGFVVLAIGPAAVALAALQFAMRGDPGPDELAEALRLSNSWNPFERKRAPPALARLIEQLPRDAATAGAAAHALVRLRQDKRAAVREAAVRELGRVGPLLPEAQRQIIGDGIPMADLARPSGGPD